MICVSSHEPDGRASLSPASRVRRVPVTSSGSPGRTRPTRFMGVMRALVRGSLIWRYVVPTLVGFLPPGRLKAPKGGTTCGPFRATGPK
ncbi:MAG: hypothetical protein FJ398_02355 [Verrucomicrobia bacterium]|nr:hypothetical protein [Verrucomicrobiota bacterium]